MPREVKFEPQSTEIVWAPLITSAPPLAPSMVARVAMKGGTRMAMMKKAFSPPNAMPTITPPGRATSRPHGLR